MALTKSLQHELGAEAPAFDLPITNPGVDGRDRDQRRLEDYAAAKALVVVFTCNHCPYAKHIEDALIDLAERYAEQGVQVVAISPNDPIQYPEDSPEAMAERAANKSYPFPYLFDETQEVAKAYGAVCTPDFFVYDAGRSLVYAGRFDETRPNMGSAHGGELAAALDELLEQGKVRVEQHPSMGCNIKWKPGNAPRRV